jgi:hypothetical protein
VGKECYIDGCKRKERMGIAWLKAGIWKLRRDQVGISEELSLCMWEEGAKHILLKSPETKTWGE